MPLAICRPQGKLCRGFQLQLLPVASRALAPSDLRVNRKRGRVVAARNRRAIAARSVKMMKREQLEALRDKVSCEVALEALGWEIDRKESSRRAVKYRRGNDIIIVTHEGRGWFDPLSDRKGDVFGLSMFLDRIPFPEAAEWVAELVGFEASRPAWPGRRSGKVIKALDVRWRDRRVPSPGSGAWRYLCRSRSIPAHIVRQAIQQDLLREGPLGSMWAAHLETDGHVVGWEERGQDWRGFATGGSKVLFRLGPADANRLCVTEAAIDAMSLAALEGMREHTLYLSTGGGWSPATDAALIELAGQNGAQLIAATDANSQGDIYADRLRGIAQAVGCDWQRLRPSADDWNEVLQMKEKENRERKMEKKDEACRMRASRVKGGFARQVPALDPAGRDAGETGGVMKD